jgi:hypothetical protein
MSETERFVYRMNSNEAIDSICLKCYLTVGQAPTIQALQNSENEHECARESAPEIGGPDRRHEILERLKILHAPEARGRREIMRIKFSMTLPMR